jgi:hypothetical protein
MFKFAVLTNLALILGSLGAGVFFLAKDGGGRRRVVTSLTVRIILSFTLIAMLVIGALTGLIKPHDL